MVSLQNVMHVKSRRDCATGITTDTLRKQELGNDKLCTLYTAERAIASR